MWWIESKPATIAFPPAPLWEMQRVEAMIAMDRVSPNPMDPARAAPVDLSKCDVEAAQPAGPAAPNGYDPRLKNPTTKLTTRQRLHIFLSQGLCAMLIATAINFAIGYGTSLPCSKPALYLSALLSSFLFSFFAPPHRLTNTPSFFFLPPLPH